MGNCCNGKPRPKPQYKTSISYISIQNTDSNTTSRVLYNPDISLEKLLVSLNIPYSHYMLVKGDFQIDDYSATLHQLGITQNDLLTLTRLEPDSPSILSKSFEEIAEEESTMRNRIENIQTSGVRRTRLEVLESSGKVLWATAISPSNNRKKVELDISSFTVNSAEVSLIERTLPFSFQFPQRMSLECAWEQSTQFVPQSTNCK